MSFAEIMNSSLFTWVILPILIFVARIFDVSIGTMRIIFTARGKRYLAPILGFFEILIWLLAIGQIFQNLNNFACYLAYAGGFATGNYIGILIEHKLALGTQVVRIITQRDASQLIDRLKDEGYGLTLIDGEGGNGAVKIIFTLIRRKSLPQIIEIIRNHNPKAFFSVEDVRFAREGVYPADNERILNLPGWLRMERKGK